MGRVPGSADAGTEKGKDVSMRLVLARAPEHVVTGSGAASP